MASERRGIVRSELMRMYSTGPVAWTWAVLREQPDVVVQPCAEFLRVGIIDSPWRPALAGDGVPSSGRGRAATFASCERVRGPQLTSRLSFRCISFVENTTMLMFMSRAHLIKICCSDFGACVCAASNSFRRAETRALFLLKSKTL